MEFSELLFGDELTPASYASHENHLNSLLSAIGRGIKTAAALSVRRLRGMMGAVC